MAIKNLIISPVVVGRISIGETVENNGRKLPKKSDEFHITSNEQAHGKWVDHPAAKLVTEGANEKLRSIPVRIMFDSPENTFRAGFSCFSNEGRMICSGNGEKATRNTPQGKQEVECLGHDLCAFGKASRCKPYGRLLVSLESEFRRDPLAAFAFRTTGYNSVNALTTRLAQFAALSNGKVAGMACNLVLRGKSTSASKRQAIYYVDIEPRGSLFEAVAEAYAWQKECAEHGINLEALDRAVTAGFNASTSVESEESLDEAGVAGEFFTDTEDAPEQSDEPQGPSHAFVSVMDRIALIDNLNKVAPAKQWIKSNRDLLESEKKQALQAIDDREKALQPEPLPLAA